MPKSIIPLLVFITIVIRRVQAFVASESGSIGNINTLFSLFHQEKKEIREAVQSWNTRNLTDSSRYNQYCSFPPVNSAKFQPPDMPLTCLFFRRFNDRLVP